MKLLIVLATFLVPLGAWSASVYDLRTPQQYASEEVPKIFDEVTEDLRLLSDASLPEETKQLRKDILKLRDHLDLFYFVYPFTEDFDLWSEVRDILDEGYQVMGEFKDLYDGAITAGQEEGKIHYKSKELNRRRQTVLNWVQKFLDFSEKNSVRDYLLNADRSQHARPPKQLSAFFWRLSDRKAQIDHVAVAPMFWSLAVEMLSAAETALKELSEQKKLIGKGQKPSSDRAVHFHDVRKRLRRVIKILEYFPFAVDEAGKATDEHQQTIASLVSEFGKLNDKIVLYDKKVDDEKNKAANRLKTEVNESWRSLRAKMIDMNALEIIKKMADQIQSAISQCDVLLKAN